MVQLCVRGTKENIDESLSASKSEKKVEQSTFELGLTLVGCALGLQVSYLTWGILQVGRGKGGAPSFKGLLKKYVSGKNHDQGLCGLAGQREEVYRCPVSRLYQQNLGLRPRTGRHHGSAAAAA